MKVSFHREKLLAAFQTAASVAPSRSPKPILQNVKMEVAGDKNSEGTAVLSATDLQVGIRVEIGGLEAHAAGSAVLPVHRFGSILRESSDEILKVETDGQNITVKGDRSQFTLPAHNPDEFPSVTEFAEKKYHELPARLLRELIRRTVFATDAESTRYALGGALIELDDKKVVAVSTDGRRLAKMEGPAQAVGGHKTGDTTTIIPTRALQLIERAITDADAEVMIACRSNDVLVKSQRVTVYSTLVEGRFPRWRDVMPDRLGAKQIEFVVGPLHAAVRQAQIVTSEDSRGVDFTFDDGKLTLHAEVSETGQSHVELPIAYEGDATTVTLDPRFVSDFLRVLDPDKNVILYLTSSDGPVLCQTEDGYSYVIMPLARER